MRRRDLKAEISAALADPGIQQAVPKGTRMAAMMRRQAVGAYAGYEAARDRARAIKEDAIERLPELLEQLRDAVTRAGGRVHEAADAEGARRTIVRIAAEEGVTSAVKSKSMTSEEVALNGALEEAGVAVRETDLGEYIVQLSGDRPSHIIAPILHKTLEDVRRAFREGLGLDTVPERPEELTQLARERLRAEFLGAQMGITGANFLIASSGTVVIVENEGNARLCTQLPRVHVALAGVDKVIPAIADLEPFLQLLPRSATGQLLTTYVTLLSGPGWGGSPLVSGPRRFHLVLLDNGRLAMRDDPVLREALYCIRCGACLNVCPPYQAVGGHVYGGPTYQSGIGNAWEAGVRGLEVAAEFNALCTTCARCRDACPVRIDIPWMNSSLRGRIRAEREGTRLIPALIEEPGRLYRLARKGGPLRALADSPPIRRLLESRLGIDRRRPLPTLPAQTLSRWFRARGGSVLETGAGPAGAGLASGAAPGDEGARTRVCLWADCHTEHVDVEVGRAAVRVLERLGFEVVLATGPCCGRAALSQGNPEEAQRQALATQELLAPALDAGLPVIAVEPSCGTCVVAEHPRLLAGRRDARLGSVREVVAFLGEHPERMAAAAPAERTGPRKVVLHGHCQQKSAGWFEPMLEALARVPGLQVHTTVADCCGMAGSFGYKPQMYELSAELGRRLLGEILQIEEAAGGSADEVVGVGTSCRAQMADLGGRPVRHPIQLIEEMIDSGGDGPA